MALLDRFFGPRAVELPCKGNGFHDMPVVGESSYQYNLTMIALGKPQRFQCTATLHLENDNPHDPDAVQVRVKRKPVGYLSASHAKRYRKQFTRRGDFVGQCPAVIVTGKDSIRGVWLDLVLNAINRKPD